MIRLNAPHPQSYGANLPLQPLTFSQLIAPTAAERAILARRPVQVRVIPAAEVVAAKLNRYSTPRQISQAQREVDTQREQFSRRARTVNLVVES